MKKTITFLILIFSVLAYSQSVDYKIAPNTLGSNYYDIVNKMRLNLASKKASRKLTRSDIKEEKHFERWAYFWRDRVNADGTFPSSLIGWKNAGLLNTGDKSISNHSKFNQSSAKISAELWTNIGPQSNPAPNGYPNPPQMGRLNAFWRFEAAIESNNILIVGAPTGGIWKSVDNGSTWFPKFDAFAGIGITDIKGSSSDANTPGVLYASTGDYDSPDTLNSIGVYKSTDFGETWVATALSSDLGDASQLGHLVVFNDNTVVVATKNAIKKSTDGGINWIDRYSEFDARYGRMASFGTNIVCTDNWGGIYRSLDSGDSWETIVASGPSANKKSVAVNESGTFYIQKSDGQIQVLDLIALSANDVGTPSSGYDSQGGYNQTLTVRGGLILDGAVNGNVSNDNGTTWYTSLNGYKSAPTDPGVYVHSDHHQMGYLNSGLSFWSVNDGGLNFIEFSSASNLDPVVEYKSQGVVTTQVYTISIDPTSAASDDFIMANQDNDGFSKESGSWVSVSAGDGVCSAIDYNNPEIRYVGGTTGALTRSTESIGYTGNYGGIALNTPGNAEFVWPLSLDTSVSTTLYGGFDEFYMSTNQGDDWTNLNAGAGKPITFDNQGQFIAIVGTSGLRRSVDGGSNWSTINQPAGNLVNSFSIDANSVNGNTIYATVKSYNYGNKVYKSIDGGGTWMNISGNLPNILMKKIVLKQNQGQEYLFVGTELGVYVTTDGGANWDKLGANLPNVIVNDLKINYLADKLFIGTYGRGMWSININNLTLSEDEIEISNTEAPIIYPNPAEGSLLNIKTSDDFNYVIYNVVGGIVAKGTLLNGQNSIDISSITSGIYIVRMTNGSKYTYSQKIIIK